MSYQREARLHSNSLEGEERVLRKGLLELDRRFGSEEPQTIEVRIGLLELLANTVLTGDLLDNQLGAQGAEAIDILEDALRLRGQVDLSEVDGRLQLGNAHMSIGLTTGSEADLTRAEELLRSVANDVRASGSTELDSKLLLRDLLKSTGRLEEAAALGEDIRQLSR